MKTRYSISAQALFLVLAVGLTLGSLLYVRPPNCQSPCMEPEHAPCPDGTCRLTEQRAGFPLPVLQDNPGGGSPTGGWGKLGPEDLPNPLTFALDVLFYSALLWLIWQFVRIATRKEPHRSILSMWPQLLVVLVGLLLGIYNERSFAVRNLPVTEGAPETVILGAWSSPEEPSGDNVILRFEKNGGLSTTVPGYTERFIGEYEWQGGDRIRFLFQLGMQPVAQEHPLCDRTPQFLRDFCTFTPVAFDLSAYPEPVAQPLSPYPAPPLPSPQPMGRTRIDGTFHVALKGHQMTLTDPSGEAHTFLRVTND